MYILLNLSLTIDVVMMTYSDAHLITMHSAAHMTTRQLVYMFAMISFYFIYSLFPPMGHRQRFIGDLLLLPHPGHGYTGANPRSWWTQVGPTARETEGTWNRTRDLPPQDLRMMACQIPPAPPGQLQAPGNK